jgi:transposase InsO family protein
VLRIRESSNNAWGGRKIERSLKRSGQVKVPSPSTITEILRRHGKLDERAHEHPGPYQRFERAAPNELWQMDFKGHFAIDRGRCHPLTVLDDHSRYSLTIAACDDEQDPTVRTCLVPVFRRYGLPFAMLMDNGPPWGDGSGGASRTIFTVWLMRLGVRVTHSRPLHPQTQGKDERFHRTLKAELLNNRTFRDLPDCQNAFDRWRHIYNHDRPHEALAMATPAERYSASPRPFPETLTPIEYADGDIVRRVDANGHISFQARRLSIGKAFRGQPIALRPSAEDGMFSVHFCAHRIGTLDLREPTPQARGFVDNASALPTTPQALQQQQLDN